MSLDDPLRTRIHEIATQRAYALEAYLRVALDRNPTTTIEDWHLVEHQHTLPNGGYEWTWTIQRRDRA